MDDVSERYKAWVVCMYNDGEEPNITVFGNMNAAGKCVLYNVDIYDHVFWQELPVYGKYEVGDENG